MVRIWSKAEEPFLQRQHHLIVEHLQRIIIA